MNKQKSNIIHVIQIVSFIVLFTSLLAIALLVGGVVYGLAVIAVFSAWLLVGASSIGDSK